MSLLGAIEDYRAGRLEDARKALAECDGIEARLCFLAVCSRIQNFEHLRAAIDVAARLRNEPALTNEDAIQLRIYLSFIMARTGDLEAAAVAIRESMAIVHTIVSPPSTLEAELALANALILFMQGRVPAAERQAWSAFYADLELGYRPKPIRVPLAPIQVTKARALTLIGVIRGTQERLHEQYRFLREAMVMLRQAPTSDVCLAATIYGNQSFYARDLGMINDIVELELSNHETWPSDLASVALEISRSLAYLYALSGHNSLALSRLASTAKHSSGLANRLLLISDEAYISRQVTNARILRAKLLEGCKLADSIDWESIDAVRYALPAFAQEVAFVDPGRALAYMHRYYSLSKNANPLTIVDKRAIAEEQYAAGIVAAANADRKHAIDSFSRAFEMWRDVGFRWRAAAAAIELGALTSDRGMIGYAFRETKRYPNSWLAVRMTTVGRRAS